MIRNSVKYRFDTIEQCNMCGSPSATHKVLGKRLNKSQGKNPKKKTGITTTIVKCTSCSLIYSNPQPIPESLQDHYGLPPENYWTPEYFKINENYFATEIVQLKKLIDFKEGMKSLDIGAGLGKGMIAMAKAGFDTYGFEGSKPFHEKAISHMGISPDRLKLGMMEEVSFPDNHFDFISFGAVLEHLYDPSASILKAMKWLKPNGIIHIEVPSSNWLVAKLINFYYKLRRGDYVGNLSPMHPPFHLHEFGLASFEKHAKLNNYEIAYSEFYVCQTFMPKPINFFIKPYMKRTNKGMQLCVWLRKK